MGINTVSANTQQTFNGVAGSAITAGDLIVNSEAGVFYPASAVLTMSQNNNTTAGPTAISAIASVVTGSYGDGNQVSSPILAQLGNGNIVGLYAGNGTTGTTNLNVYTRNIQGAGAVNTFAISDSSISYFKVKTVNSTSYVVAWLSSTTLKFAIYTNAGVVVKSATTIGTVSSTSATSWNMQALTNGNIVFAWNNSGSLNYAIYDSTGTSVLASTAIEASSTPDYITIVKQTGGGFFVYYFRSAATTAYKFGRYNSSGVLQGSLTTVVTSNGTLSGCFDDNFAFELSNGNVVFCAANASSYPFYYVYNSSGTVVVSALDVSSSSSTISYPGIVPGACATPSGFVVVTPGGPSNTRYYNVFDTSGNAIIQRKVTGTLTSTQGWQGSGNGYQRVFSNGSAGVTVHEQVYYPSGCSFFYQTQVYSFDLTGTQRGTTVILQASSGSLSSNLYGISLSDGSVVVTHRNSAGTLPTNWGTYAMLRKSIVGVAQTTAAINSTATVYTQGNFTINQSMGFGGYFDNRTATVPGTRGTVVGTNAVLLGLS